MSILLAWLATYTIHSTALLAAAWLLHRTVVTAPAARDILWRAGLIGGLITATLQTSAAWRPLGGVVAVRTAPPSVEAHPMPALLARAKGPAVATLPREDAGVVTKSSTPVPWRTVLFFGWAAGGIALVARLVARKRRLVEELGPRVVVSAPEVLSVAARLAEEAGLRGGFRLTSVAGTVSPMALGAREICVPTAALDVPGEELEGMLAHEVAHLARRDPIWLDGLSLLECVLFFQPLNRLGRRRLMEAAEYLCDDWVVEHTGTGRPLAGCLIRVAEWIDTARRPYPVVGMAEHRSQLVERIHRLLEDRGMTIRPKKHWMVLGAVGLLATTAVVAPSVVVRHGQAPTTPDTLDRQKAEIAGPPRGGLFAPAKVAMAGMAGMLGHRQEPDSAHGAIVTALIEALKDEDVEVRRAAAQSLGSRQDRRAVPALVAALKDVDVEVRHHAIDALASLEDPRAIDGLVAALRDESADARMRAVEGLSHFSNDQKAADGLASRLDDPAPEVKARAAGALVEFQDKRAVPALLQMLTARDPDTRRGAIHGLVELKVTSALSAILARAADDNAEVRQSVAQAAGELQAAEAVPMLKELLDDSNPEVRESAIGALSEIRDRAAIDVLVGALKAKDPNVRRRAAEALGER